MITRIEEAIYMRIPIMKILRLPVCAVFVFLFLLAVMAGSASSEGVEVPGTIIIKYIQDKYSPVTFEHTMHADMANSCGECLSPLFVECFNL
jgi:hypothetical protein